MVREMNALGGIAYPKDGGLGGGSPVGPIDFVAVGGDVANREESSTDPPVPPARESWAAFEETYLRGLTLRAADGSRAPVYVVPGNHDATNAVGFYRPMQPARDPTAMIGIYNLMMRPPAPLTEATFSFTRDKVRTTRDIGGAHLEFLQIWPDRETRAWIARDLQRVSATTPVIMFAHDQPEAEAKHFINPNGTHDVNEVDRFENLLGDRLQDGTTIETAPTSEAAAFEALLAAHPNLTAYFHGNANWNQFYDWTGPTRSASLHVFRVDSPMKGALSAEDERRLSFQVVTVDTAAGLLTVREYLWNARPDQPGATEWGGSTTVALAPRPRPLHGPRSGEQTTHPPY
jgi:hypothetical protein